MTEFQKKRLAYFKKASTNYDWVRLGPGDIEIFNESDQLKEEIKDLKEELKDAYERIDKAGV